MSAAGSMGWLWLASLALIVLAVAVDRAWQAGYDKGKADAKTARGRSGLFDGMVCLGRPLPPPNTASAKGNAPIRPSPPPSRND